MWIAFERVYGKSSAKWHERTRVTFILQNRIKLFENHNTLPGSKATP